MRRTGLVGSLAAALAVAVGTRVESAPDDGEADRRTGFGKEAAKAGKPGLARRHFLDALAVEATHGPAWAALAALDGDDPDARALWHLDAASARVDAAGRPPKHALPAPLVGSEAAAASALAARRATLVRAVAEAATRHPKDGSVVVARWLRTLAVEASSGVAALATPSIAAADAAVERCRPDGSRLRAALRQAQEEAEAAGDLRRAVEAARLLVGLGVQRRAASGEKPTPEDAGPRFALSRLRSALREKGPPPLAFADLEGLLAPERRLAFEDAHATFGDPIVATSGKGRYRIESACGLMATKEAARVVEGCHDRLVAWLGKDPFVGRPGLVRLCPSYEEIEAEGQPYWWAQGFQAGDETAVVVRWNGTDDLVRLLAHELTHRFDGALLPGLPAFAAEGRAEYVATVTPHAGADAFDERLLDLGALEDAARLLGGWKGPLVALVDGKDPEYRHNYPVGYAIWTFLSRWTGDEKPPDGVAPYRARIPALLDALRRSPGASSGAIEATLCDGSEGRARDLGGFSRQLSRFLDGVTDGRDRPEWARVWADRSVGTRTRQPQAPWLTDRANHPTSRHRLAAPSFGDGLAAKAADLLDRCGRKADALEAHALADAVDEVDPARWRRALALEVALERPGAAFARRRLLERTTGGTPDPAERGLPVSLAPAVDRHLDGLAKAAEEALAGRRPRTARALRADHDRVARLVGRPALGDAGLAPPPPLPEGFRHGAPDCPPPTNPLAAGVVEERWSAQEDGEVRGLFGFPSPDEVELGRKSEGPTVTGADTDARLTGVAVRTVETLSGTYTVRMRVRPAAAYVDARVVVGWTRRDRGTELRFHAGDRRTAEEKGVSAGAGGTATLWLSDLREVDGRASDLVRTMGLSETMDGPVAFDLALHVSGPYVRVEVDGRDVLSMRRATGEPVEGWLGFVSDRGRIRFADVRVERHRALGPDAACRCGAFDEPLSFARPNRFSWTSVVGRRVDGLAPSPHVRLLLWSTGLDADDPMGADSVLYALAEARDAFRKAGYPLEAHVAVLGVADEEGRHGPPEGFLVPHALKIPPAHLHAHRGFPGLADDYPHVPHGSDLGWPLWGGIFVDPSGIARARGPVDGVDHGLRLARWTEGR